MFKLDFNEDNTEINSNVQRLILFQRQILTTIITTTTTKTNFNNNNQQQRGLQIIKDRFINDNYKNFKCSIKLDFQIQIFNANFHKVIQIFNANLHKKTNYKFGNQIYLISFEICSLDTNSVNLIM